MSKRVIKIGLSSHSINTAIEELMAYKNEIVEKCRIVVARLAEHGIEVAKEHLSDGYGNYITFSVETNDSEIDGCTAFMLATQTGTIVAQWQLKDGSIKTAEVSPLLMAEWGSGQHAIEGHRGTFPNQTHAFENSWSWKDLNDQWHTSSGIIPTQPMFNAAQEMITRINEVMNEVFGNDGR